MDETPLNIFLDIIQTDSGFLEALNRSSKSVEMILMTIKVIKMVITTPFTAHIGIFLNEVCETKNYWNQIEAVLKETTIKKQSNAVPKQKKKNTKLVLNRNGSEIWQPVLELCSLIAKRGKLPSKFIENIFKIMDENPNDPNLKQLKMKYEILLNDSKYVNKGMECFQTYYELNIYPSLDELKQKQKVLAYVKPNIIKGCFESVIHYLDIHLALLREDFMSPLREGLIL